MIECYPVIYTRTFTCDYFANFHAKPDFIDVQWARKYILSAMDSIDTLDSSGREIVFSNDEYLVFGIVSYTSDLINKCAISENEKGNLRNYAFDCKKRHIYGFFGFALYKTNKQIPKVEAKDYLDIFKEYIIPAWNQTYSETKISTGVLLNQDNDIKVTTNSSASRNEINFYSNTNNLFKEFICKAASERVSYCSNITDYQQIKNSTFSSIATTDNNINRYLRENPEKIEVVNERTVSNNITNEQSKYVKRNNDFRNSDRPSFNSANKNKELKYARLNSRNDAKRYDDIKNIDAEKKAYQNNAKRTYSDTDYGDFNYSENGFNNEKKSVNSSLIEQLQEMIKQIIDCILSLFKSR